MESSSWKIISNETLNPKLCSGYCYLKSAGEIPEILNCFAKISDIERFKSIDGVNLGIVVKDHKITDSDIRMVTFSIHRDKFEKIVEYDFVLSVEVASPIGLV